jgi:glycosyltransferase involved in cell wall biosynthesis
MHVLRRTDRRRFQMDFLVHTARGGAYDDEIRSLGSRIIRCVEPRALWRYLPALDRVLRTYGPYDVLHSHLHRFSGVVLRMARRRGIPVRIAHSHVGRMTDGSGPLRAIYRGLADRWLQDSATVGLACSTQAAIDLFGKAWSTDWRWRVVSYGIDVAPFRSAPERERVRAELGLGPEAVVLGHVGRFDPQKNHAFLLDIIAAARRIEPRVRPLLIGDGPLRPAMERRASELGLAAIFTGTRPDVSRLMLGAMDVFVFPSLFEGLGLVLVEAQAAGLPVVTTDVLPPESTVVSDAVRRLSLAQPAAEWARTALTIPRPDRDRCLDAVAASPFNLAARLDRLFTFYQPGHRNGDARSDR